MEKALFLASCPLCGRALFRGSAHSYIESGCPKCGEYLRIIFAEDGFRAAVGKPGKPEGVTTSRKGTNTME